MIYGPSGHGRCGGAETDAWKAAEARWPRRSKRRRRSESNRARVMKNCIGAGRIPAKKRVTKNTIIAEAMNVTVRCVQKPWARFKNAPEASMAFPARTGRPRGRPAKSGQSAADARRGVREHPSFGRPTARSPPRPAGASPCGASARLCIRPAISGRPDPLRWP